MPISSCSFIYFILFSHPFYYSSPKKVSYSNAMAIVAPFLRSVQTTTTFPPASYAAALAAQQVGINVVPISTDGSKRPPFKWEQYQHRRTTSDELRSWFVECAYGLGFVTGKISGNLELLDFDTREIFAQWSERMEREGVGPLANRLMRGYLEETPNGMHLWYRCRLIEGNQPLARVRLSATKRKALIETRGEGGLGVAAPSDGTVHPSGRSYRVVQGSVTTMVTLTVPERERVLAVARSFDTCSVGRAEQGFRPVRKPEDAILDERRSSVEGERPGDLLNQYGTWEEVLEPHGWRLLQERDEEGYWTKNRHTHATTNYQGSGLLYVFSTTTLFEPERGYSKFAAFTLLTFGSLSPDALSAAARELAARGYSTGVSREKLSGGGPSCFLSSM